MRKSPLKLDQRRNQQSECGQEAKCNPEILGKEKSTKTKNPSHQNHDLELAGRMRFQDLERHEQDKNRYSRLKAFQGTITDKDANESRECQQQLQNCRAKPVPSWLHPEFQGEGQQKNTWHPAHERTEHGRHREEQGGCKPKQWSPRNTPITLAPAHAPAPETIGSPLRSRRT